MVMKSHFLNGVIQEEVYVRQPTSLKNPKFFDIVYKLSKALYGPGLSRWCGLGMLGLRRFC
jgi:hypothetical protein